jgi:hypothetical protein
VANRDIKMGQLLHFFFALANSQEKKKSKELEKGKAGRDRNIF